MKKLTVIFLALCLLLSGCGNTHSFDIQTGETVEVELASGSGFRLTANNQSFILEKEGVQTQCDFVEQDLIDDYLEWIPGAPGGECIEWGYNDCGTYMYYSMDYGEYIEYGYVCNFDGTYLGVMLYNRDSEASVRACVASLSFSYDIIFETTGRQ